MWIDKISVWGLVPIVLLLVAAMVVLWMADERTLHKLVGFGGFKSWRGLSLRLKLVTALSILVSVAIVSGCMILALPYRLFFPIAGVLLVVVLVTVPPSMQAYTRSLKHTVAHRRYLLAGGASHMESIMPSVRRALRTSELPLALRPTAASVVVIVIVFCCLMAAGLSVWSALLAIILLWAASISATVMAVVLGLWLADRMLFDKHENVTTTGKP